MEAAGLRRIMDICRQFGYSQIELQLDAIDKLIEADERVLREQVDKEILQDYNNPLDVFRAVAARTEGTKAYSYFVSAMQHLLLIREEGPALDHYFQIIDSTVSDIVLNNKLNGAEARLGGSVQRIIAQMNDAERLQQVEEQLAEARASALHMKLEKDALSAQVSQGAEGLVGELREKVSDLEKKLESARETIEMVQGRAAEDKRLYEETITQLEMQIMELFRMLKELGRGVESVVDKKSIIDRRALLAHLERRMHHSKTISLLEGRRDEFSESPADGKDGESRPNGLPAKGTGTAQSRLQDSRMRGSMSVFAMDSHLPRDSQFMDADEAIVQEHLQDMARGLDSVCFPSHNIDFLTDCA